MSREDFIKMAHKIVSYQSAMAEQWSEDLTIAN
jgi:hypothetical protein